MSVSPRAQEVLSVKFEIASVLPKVQEVLSVMAFIVKTFTVKILVKEQINVGGTFEIASVLPKVQEVLSVMAFIVKILVKEQINVGGTDVTDHNSECIAKGTGGFECYDIKEEWWCRKATSCSWNHNKKCVSN
eukprot:70975_1